MNGGEFRGGFAAPRTDGDAVETPDATESAIAELRVQLDAATAERKRAATRARYLRHAIGNLETAHGVVGVS